MSSLDAYDYRFYGYNPYNSDDARRTVDAIADLWHTYDPSEAETLINSHAQFDHLPYVPFMWVTVVMDAMHFDFDLYARSA
jgi:hypothetical protein